MMTFLAWGMSLLFASEHNTWGLALLLGGALTVINTFLVHFTPSKIAYTGVGMVLMCFVSLHAHQLHGMIEAHFGYFIFIAVLFASLDWRAIVVADEVRNLATRSQQSTKRISEIIHRLKESSETSVGVMQASVAKVAENSDKSRTVVVIFNHIGSSLRTMSELGKEIARVSNQQDSSTQTLLNEASKVENVAAQSQQASAQLAHRFKILADEFNGLNQNLEQIKVGA
ncbi:MAG: hypothetical protein RL217_1261 [Pseudomonadota bacterium]|jgi:hypothetical protein